MSLPVKAATVNSYTKYQVFSGYAILVITHDANQVSQFPDKDPETGEETPKMQAFATIIPLEDGEHRADNGTKTSWKAGDVHKSFIDGKRIRPQVMEEGTPIVGRLGKGKPGKKGGAPWLLKPPTDADLALVDKIPGLEETVNEVIESAKSRTYTARSSKEDAAEPVAETSEDSGDTELPWKD